MTVLHTNPTRTPRALLGRLVGWVVALMAGTVALSLLVVSMVATQANDDAGIAERQRLISVISQRVNSMQELLYTAARSEASNTERLIALAAPHFDMVGIWLRDEPGSPWLARHATASFAVANDQLDMAIRTPSGKEPAPQTAQHAAPELFSLNDQMVVRIAIGLSGSRELVALRTFDANALRQIAELSQAKRFAVVGGAAPDSLSALIISDLVTGAGTSLTWESSLPGNEIRAVALLTGGPVLLVFSLLFAVVIVNTRRIAGDLATSQSIAEQLAGIDPLSGLPNRLLFGNRLDQELCNLDGADDGLALMFLDLDRFKEVNDAHGHQAGDELIKQVARRLLTVLRGADTLSRFGGDEFAIMQPGIRNAGEAEDLARRILSALRTPFNLEGTAVDIGVSIGIALAPRHARDRETLMRLADTALYDAKSAGRNRFSLFVEQMDEAIRLRKVVADDLRDAIRNDGLTVHYQPIYASTGDEIVSLEALVRWQHPTQGMIPPAKFIPLAEQSGLIIPLGEWVLKRVCLDGHRWPGMKIAVNVSPIQFRRRDFVECVLDIVQNAGMDPSRIEFELTEGVVVEDADAAESAIMELRAYGFSLALDDFGSGYSSLIYLRRFAFDKIKIDRSFLESMEGTGESAILVHSIVHLGRALGLTVTAEGVETKEQHRFLQALGCHELQGFLFSRPVQVEQIDVLLGVSDTPPLAVLAAS